MCVPFDGQSEGAAKARIILDALVKLAKNQLRYDFFISKMLWGVGLYLATGQFRVANWRRYPRISDAALALRRNDPNWRQMVTFDHARPLRDVYRLMKEEGDGLTVERAARIINEYPPVIITRMENQDITDRGFRNTGAPEERYSNIALSFPLRSNCCDTSRT